MSVSWSGRAGRLVLVVVVAGCTGAGATPSPAMSDVPPAPTATAPATPAPTDAPSAEPTVASSPDPTLEPPPGADLVAAGERHPGEVGSYVWSGASDSAPWLPATALDPAPVGDTSQASVDVAGEAEIAEWTARAAPAADPTGTAITPLGSGAGSPSFELPAGGDWVVAVQAVFAGGLGDVTWYWHVTRE
jgi:hypothetical protein